MRQTINDYLATVEKTLRQVDPVQIEAAADVLFQAYLHGRTVFTMGNGASAALAAHIACDLGKGTAIDLGLGPDVMAERRLRIISMTDNIALLTAYSNGLDYRDIFVEQLKNMLRAGDVVLGISGSGESPNVLRAMLYARERDAVTIGFTGARPSGNRLADLCDVCVRAPLTMLEQIEDLHVIFHHAISVALRTRIQHHTAHNLGASDPTTTAGPTAVANLISDVSDDD